MTILCASLAEFLQEVPGPRDFGEPVYVCGWYAPHETVPNVYGLWIVVTAARSAREIVEWRQVVGAPMSKADRDRAEFALSAHLNSCLPDLTTKYGKRVGINRRIMENAAVGSMVYVTGQEKTTHDRAAVGQLVG